MGSGRRLAAHPSLQSLRLSKLYLVTEGMNGMIALRITISISNTYRKYIVRFSLVFHAMSTCLPFIFPALIALKSLVSHIACVRIGVDRQTDGPSTVTLAVHAC